MDDGRKYAVPFVATIIERTHNGVQQVLVGVRNHTLTESIYNGTLEFVAGTLDLLYENVYDTLSREVFEETGLQVSKIINDSQKDPISPHKIDKVFGFRPFCCTQQLKDGRPWVGFIFRCEVKPGKLISQDGENQDLRWMDIKEFKKIYTTTPEKIFSLEYPAWQYYFDEITV